MKLNYFSNVKLDEKIKSLAASERELLKEILLTIKEIDRRKLFLDYGFSSLFEYLVKSVGYSEGSAQRRIDGSRLLRDIPEIAKDIESGAIKLSQISLVQQAARQVLKVQSRKVHLSEKSQLIKQLANKSHSQSQKEIAEFFNIQPEINTVKKVQADESIRYQITISKELYEKVKRAQSLLSHSLESEDLVTYIEYVTDKVIKQKTTANLAVKPKLNEPKPGVAVKPKLNDSNPDMMKPLSPITATLVAEPVRQKIRKQILGQKAYCQFQDSRSKNICGSTWKLQVDHLQPRWAGGSNDPDNLQILCASHNLHRYKVQAQIRLKS